MADTSGAGAGAGSGPAKPPKEGLKKACMDGGFAVDKSKGIGKKAQMPFLATDQYADVQIPTLKQFDPQDIKIDGTVIAIGKRRTGKSWCFRNIMYEMKDKIPAGIVISQTDELNKFWRQYVPKKYIYNKYMPEILDFVFRRQKAILNHPQLSKEEKEKQAPFFVLLDDVISDQRLKYDENLMELFVAGRHYKIFTLITTQYAKAITPVIRGNSDYILVCKTMQGRQRESLWEDFGDFMTKDGFYTLMDNYTEDNEVLVFDTSENTSNPLDMIKWWKAEDPGDYKMGSKEYWDSSMKDFTAPPMPQMKAASKLATMNLPNPYKQMGEQSEGSTSKGVSAQDWTRTVYAQRHPLLNHQNSGRRRSM